VFIVFFVFTVLCFYLFFYFELQAQTGCLLWAFFFIFFVFHETVCYGGVGSDLRVLLWTLVTPGR
jgi:hypothetical protein